MIGKAQSGGPYLSFFLQDHHHKPAFAVVDFLCLDCFTQVEIVCHKENKMV